MGYLHSRESILEAAVEVALELGMAGLTFSKVGARLGISDRTVVYYFPNKQALIGAVASALVRDLEGLLDQAFGSTPRSERELVKRSWPALTTPQADQVFRLYFEIVGLAAAGQAQFKELAQSLVGGWVQWLMPRTVGTDEHTQRVLALSAIARIDGLLVVRQVLGSAVSEEFFLEVLNSLEDAHVHSTQSA